MSDRFSKMRSYEDTDHPLVMFYPSKDGLNIDGLDILSLNPSFLNNYIQGELKEACEHNFIKLSRDWKKLSSNDAIKIIQQAHGKIHATNLPYPELNQSYVITVDNLVKMISILFRLKNNIPCITMGECGCGKSSLINQLCAILHIPLKTLNIHGGMSDEDIMIWMADAIYEARSLPENDIMIAFLDEINTCNSMGLFKEIVCDNSMNGDITNTIKNYLLLVILRCKITKI